MTPTQSAITQLSTGSFNKQGQYKPPARHPLDKQHDLSIKQQQQQQQQQQHEDGKKSVSKIDIQGKQIKL